MELKQLEYFCMVVEAGSISEAARRLNMSQPPLSYHMKMLEEELHVTLFQRGRRKIELTDAGRLLYERAGTLIHLERAIGREVSGTGNVRTLRLGVTPTTAPLAVPALAAMNRMTGGLHFELFEGNTYQLREMLSGHLLDASFLRSPVNMEGFSTCRLKTEPLVAAGDISSFSDRTYTDLRELALMPLILYRRYDAFIRQAFYHAGLSPDIHCICDDARTAMMMVKEGMGAAILPQSMVPSGEESLYRIIREKELETDILLVWNGNLSEHALVEMLLDRLRENGYAEQHSR